LLSNTPLQAASAKLVEELRGVEGEGRRARYVCELVLIGPEGGFAEEERHWLNGTTLNKIRPINCVSCTTSR
jgi:16S rRNA U1498 N3-methylase RsmE